MAAQATIETEETHLEAPWARGRQAIVGHLLKWRADPIGLLASAAREDDVVRLNLLGQTFLITHPAHVKHVLQDNNQNYVKGWVFDRIRPYWGESLLTAGRRRLAPTAAAGAAVVQAGAYRGLRADRHHAHR